MQGSSKQKRLRDAVRWHYEKLEWVRKRRREAIALCAGDRYAKDEQARKTIIGLSRQALEAHVLDLAANLPRVLITGKRPELSAAALRYGKALNINLAEIHFLETLQALAYDSFFDAAFAKIYLRETTPPMMESHDIWIDPGQGYVERKSIDDLSYDTNATDFRKCTFVADRYQLPLEVILKNKHRFKRGVTDTLIPTKHDEDGRAATIGGWDSEDTPGHFVDMIDLVDVYVPGERKTYTYAADSNFRLREKVLQEVEWEGDEEGPYRMLNLGIVPDNLRPSAPANYLYHLDVGINQSWRKVLRQLERMKVVTCFDPVTGRNSAEDVETLTDAEDGDAIPLPPDTTKEVRLGGPDNQSIGTTQMLTQLFDRGANNLQARVGLGPSADTASQDQMIGQSVTRVAASQQEAFRHFATGLVKEIGRMLFEDPQTEYSMELEVPNSAIRIPSQWMGAGEDGARLGEWNEYDYCIEPNSMPYKSREQRAQYLMSDVANVVQLGPMLMQMGGDVGRYIEILSELHDLPRLKEVFAQMLQPQQEQQPQQQMQLPGQKPNGNYTRTNVSSGEPDNSMIQQMMSSPRGDAA